MDHNKPTGDAISSVEKMLLIDAFGRAVDR